MWFLVHEFTCCLYGCHTETTGSKCTCLIQYNCIDTGYGIQNNYLPLKTGYLYAKPLLSAKIAQWDADNKCTRQDITRNTNPDKPVNNSNTWCNPTAATSGRKEQR